jgi:hypothetical protein
VNIKNDAPLNPFYHPTNTRMSDIASLLNEMKTHSILKERIKKKFMDHLQIIGSKEPTYCVVSNDCNHAYSDEFLMNPDGTYLLVYRGQKVSKSKDKYLMNPHLPKVLFIRKGSEKRFPSAIFGDWKLKPEYFFGGYISQIVLVSQRHPDSSITHPEPVYLIYFTYNKQTPMNKNPLSPEWMPCIEYMQAQNKLAALLSCGIIPKNRQYNQGIQLCWKKE